MRILVRTSNWAIWASRFASLALPLVVIPIILHHRRIVSGELFTTLQIIAASVAGLALLLSLGALVNLWISGDNGWPKAFSGLFLSLFCLVPVSYAGIQALRYPMVWDVSTSSADPPRLLTATARPPAPTEAAMQVQLAFPNVHVRRYRLPVGRIYDIALQLADERGWEIVASTAPNGSVEEGHINAFATTLFGWREEVSLRIHADSADTTVDMRSMTLEPAASDFGSNGLRIEEFLMAMDAAVTTFMRNEPLEAASEEEGDDETLGDDDALSPTPRPAPRPAWLGN